jgi:hypothetical protein
MAAVCGAAGPNGGWCIVLVVVECDGSLVLVVEATRVVVPPSSITQSCHRHRKAPTR